MIASTDLLLYYLQQDVAFHQCEEHGNTVIDGKNKTLVVDIANFLRGEPNDATDTKTVRTPLCTFPSFSIGYLEIKRHKVAVPFSITLIFTKDMDQSQKNAERKQLFYWKLEIAVTDSQTKAQK